MTASVQRRLLMPSASVRSSNVPSRSIPQQILPAAVVGVFEALRHDARCRELPEIDPLVPVAGDEEIETSVAVVVEPRGAVGVDPPRKAYLASPTATKRLPLFVAEQLRAPVSIQQEVLVAVVVVVAPDGAHRDAGLAPIHVGDAVEQVATSSNVPSPLFR